MATVLVFFFNLFGAHRLESIFAAFLNSATGVDIPDGTGMGGTSTTGNICDNLFTSLSEVLVSQVPEEHREDMRTLLVRVWIILKLYGSDKTINTLNFETFCTETEEFLLTHFKNEVKKWIYLSPTVHSVFEHTGEIIRMNGGKGVKAYAETSLENNNKFLRFYRRALARKTSQTENLDDCLTRLWLKSDPCLRLQEPQKQCRKCGADAGHYTVSCPLKFSLLITVESREEMWLKELVIE